MPRRSLSPVSGSAAASINESHQTSCCSAQWLGRPGFSMCRSMNQAIPVPRQRRGPTLCEVGPGAITFPEGRYAALDAGKPFGVQCLGSLRRRAGRNRELRLARWSIESLILDTNISRDTLPCFKGPGRPPASNSTRRTSTPSVYLSCVPDSTSKALQIQQVAAGTGEIARIGAVETHQLSGSALI